jgi:hypothetical protein
MSGEKTALVGICGKSFGSNLPRVGKQRKRPYLGHLSKTAFGELKRKHKGAALERAIAEWIAEHDR